jgi:hypothetical protein
MQRELSPLAQDALPVPLAEPALLDGLLQPRLSLFWGAHSPTRALLTLATALAVNGHAVRVFDGGNRFDGYLVARLARRLCAHPYAVLERMRLSRAFTCFQLAELLENAPEGLGPLFVLDLLSTFYDESVPLRDSERLLITTIGHIKRLAAVGPVIVGARQARPVVEERWSLLDRLQAAADAAWMLRAPAEEAGMQMRLF